MARGVNKVIIIGNLGKDPEVHFSQGGIAFGNFSIATTESRKNKETDKWEDHTEWHRVVVLGRTAEVAKEYLHKGAKVYIEGRLQTKKYTDKQGIERYQTEIVTTDMQMLGGGKGSESAPEKTQGATDIPTSYDDDVPF